MITVPSIVMLSLLAFMSMFAASILSRPWMRWTALTLATMETIMVVFLVMLAKRL